MELQKQLRAAESALASKAEGDGSSRLLKEEVTEDDIAEIISKWTGGWFVLQLFLGRCGGWVKASSHTFRGAGSLGVCFL
jgi:hypothetical protein